jgi:hypothetical protein
LKDLQVATTVDVIGAAVEVGNIGSIRVKSTGEDRERKVVTIADETNCSVVVTLWGPNAHL